MKWLIILSKKIRIIFQEVLKKYEEVLEGIKKDIETINGGEKIQYGKDF